MSHEVLITMRQVFFSFFANCIYVLVAEARFKFAKNLKILCPLVIRTSWDI